MAHTRLIVLFGALALAISISHAQDKGQNTGQMGKMTMAQRQAARAASAPQKTGVNKIFAGINPATASVSPLAKGPADLAVMAAPNSTPDYFGVANWANSPLPQLTAAGALVSATGMLKFIDTLPGICAASAPNGLGQCIPLAVPDITTFPGSDFYRIGLRDYAQQMHSDLPATKLRGYVLINRTGSPIYDFFCSTLCRDKFDRNPGQYLSAAVQHRDHQQVSLALP